MPDNLRVVPGSGDNRGRAALLSRQDERRSSPDATSRTRARESTRRPTDPRSTSPSTPRAPTASGAPPARNVGRRLAIILDDVIYSAPVIQSQISDEGQITNVGSAQEADELSKVLRAGALPANLRYLQELTVGASLGRDSIRSGIMASAAGMAFITIFMLFYYRFSGINAVVALIGNLIILLGAMAYSGASLTLPGIAGVILTVGVGVDTNVLVFERIREELRNGKTVRIAVQNGFDRVWITIIDTHATALIAAAFLFQFGTGPVKGFAVTLVIGLVGERLRVLLRQQVPVRVGPRQAPGRHPEHLTRPAMEILKNPNFDFMGKAKVLRRGLGGLPHRSASASWSSEIPSTASSSRVVPRSWSS